METFVTVNVPRNGSISGKCRAVFPRGKFSSRTYSVRTFSSIEEERKFFSIREREREIVFLLVETYPAVEIRVESDLPWGDWFFSFLFSLWSSREYDTIFKQDPRHAFQRSRSNDYVHDASLFRMERKKERKESGRSFDDWGDVSEGNKEIEIF